MGQKKWARDLAFDVIGAIMYAASLVVFAANANFAPGGISGLSIVLHHLFGVPIGTTGLVLNIPLVLLSLRFVGAAFLLKTLCSMVICAVFVDVIFPFLPSYHGDPLLASLFAGVCMGVALAMFYRHGSSSGGTDLLTMSIRARCPHLSMGSITLAIDLAIIGIGGLVYGNVDAVLYGIIATTATSFVLDRMLNGVGAGKLLVIITSDGQAVADHIGKVASRGSTMSRGVGTYTGSPRDILFCACSRAEAWRVRAAAYQVDPDCFVMISDTSEVYGEGFIDPLSKDSFIS